jgi:hypothetical protein
MRPMPFLLVVAAVVGAACSKSPDEAPPPRTPAEQRAIDSTVGASRLPGAGGVQGALRASDSAAARARTLDSLSRNP